MYRAYKQLMQERKTTIARLADNLFMLILACGAGFVYAFLKLGSVTAAWVIGGTIGIITILLLWKMNEIRTNGFVKKINTEIEHKLVLEKIALYKEQAIEIEGYSHLKDNEYYSKEGGFARLLRVYPQSVLTPKDILEYIDSDTLIASCTFDDDCYLLCKRLGVQLLDKEFLLEHTKLLIDEKQIEREIHQEVEEISAIKKGRKRSAFARERWSKYLLTALLLLGVSGFMGRFQVIYIAFGGMCMTFCMISLMLSKSQ